jgi:hypothetical protein
MEQGPYASDRNDYPTSELIGPYPCSWRSKDSKESTANEPVPYLWVGRENMLHVIDTFYTFFYASFTFPRKTKRVGKRSIWKVVHQQFLN